MLEVGARFKFYDGSGDWGWWELTITEVTDKEVSYTGTNAVTGATTSQTVSRKDAEDLIRGVGGWQWEPM